MKEFIKLVGCATIGYMFGCYITKKLANCEMAQKTKENIDGVVEKIEEKIGKINSDNNEDIEEIVSTTATTDEKEKKQAKKVKVEDEIIEDVEKDSIAVNGITEVANEMY